eukprot:g16334.t1
MVAAPGRVGHRADGKQAGLAGPGGAGWGVMRTKFYDSGSAGLWALVCNVLVLQARNASGQYELCTGSLATVENGVCDASNNVASCLYDGGDCCPSTCSSSAGLCTEDTRQCFDPLAPDYPYGEFGDCVSVSGNLPYIQDGICDIVNNNAQCGYDGGDCCPSTCVPSTHSHCPTDNSECVDPLAGDFGYPGYETCTGYLPTMGNGLCNSDANNEACSFDGGDCCECSCIPGQFLCLGRFDCLDPAFNTTDTECSTTTPTCSAALPKEWVVEDTAGATALARAIDCTGGAFDVEWKGHVAVTHTIWVSGGTALNITGVWAGATPAVADGGGENRIFGVANASLHLDGMVLTNGHAIVGGAVYVALGTARFEGQMSFVNNSADEHGGALFLDEGEVSWDGDVSFADNSCSWDGGAILVRHGNISWAGTTTFMGNRIHSFGHNGGYSFGGAIYAIRRSTISWTGQTRFIDNRVDLGDFSVSRDIVCNGGAVALGTNSSASWNGSTTFENNQVSSCGGGLYANDTGSFSWTGETVFSENRAGSGGVMCLEFFSAAVWLGLATFVGNNAGENGGALYVTSSSSAAWSGNGQTVFERNSARDGGAAHLSDASSLSWEADTIIRENVALGSGGGLFIGEGAEVSWDGTTEFSHNRADMNGGAVVSVLSGVTGAMEAHVSMDDNTTFYNNSCQNYGGALMVSGQVLLTIWPEGVTFRANSAGSAGGAVCLTGVGVGPEFRGIRFDSNSAQIGGAVYSTGSGTALLTSGEEFPVRYDDCSFLANRATASGGAVESAAGKDVVTNSTFVNNTARQGGAMRLAGAVSLSGCIFKENSADITGGPAISNVGLTESIESSSFANNYIRCNPGSFVDFVEGDRYTDVCSGCAACNDCNVADGNHIPTCTNVLVNTKSAGDNVVLETLIVDGGYWRATPSSRDILACHNPGACLGGETEAAGYCADGYQGPYCAVCREGYAESLAYTCSSCSDRKARVMAMVVLPVTVVLGVAFLGYMISKEHEVRLHRLKRLVPLQSIKIVIVVWQILTEFTSVATISFPDAYERFLDGADILNFDMGWILAAGCFLEIDFHDRVITSTLGPLTALSVLGLTYGVAWYRNRSCHQALQKVRRKHVSVALWMTFLVYSSVSSTIFKVFSCENLDDGERYLRADYRILCSSSKHQAMQVYAGFMIFVYPVGIPLMYAALLFWGRDALKIAAVRNMDESHVQAAAQLSSPYRPGCFYYEVIECVRRVLLTGVIVFILPNERSQVAVTLVIACMFALVFEALAPYDSKWDAWISRSGHVIVLLSIFVAFLLEQQDSEETGNSSHDLYGGVLLAFNVSMVLVVAVQGVTMAFSVTRPAEALPRSVSLAAEGFHVQEHGHDSHGRHDGRGTMSPSLMPRRFTTSEGKADL